MGTLRVFDRIRDRTVELSTSPEASVADVTEEMIATYGLPRADRRGVPLEYDLVDETSGNRFHATTLAAEVEATGGQIALVSSEAQDVWQRVRDLSQALHSELGVSGRAMGDAAKAEVRASAGRVRAQVEEEVRALIRDSTQGIEAEVERRIRKAGREISMWTRRKIRRYIKEVGPTGALPTEISALSVATGRLTSVAQAALVVPVAGAVVAASVAGGAAAGTIVGGDRPDEPTSPDPAIEGLETEIARMRAELGQLRSDLDAVTLTVSEHRAADDPHSIEPLAQVTADVMGSVTTGLPSDWVSALLGEANGLIDQHRSTSFTGGEVRRTIEPGESLWRIAQDLLATADFEPFGLVCATDPLAEPTNRQIADYVTALWVANIGVIGSSPGSIEAGTEMLQVVCPPG